MSLSGQVLKPSQGLSWSVTQMISLAISSGAKWLLLYFSRFTRIRCTRWLAGMHV
jgi:hypothetical protein